MSEREIRDKIKAVNQLLAKGEPHNISVDHKGRAGYTPQSVIDSMNATFDFGAWGFDEISSEMIENDQAKSLQCVSQVRVWLFDAEGNKLPYQPTAWGEGTQPSTSPGDVRKAAQTDALKKALSYFSVGNRAYHGKLGKEKRK